VIAVDVQTGTLLALPWSPVNPGDVAWLDHTGTPAWTLIDG